MLSKAVNYKFGATFAGIKYTGLEKWGIKNRNLMYNLSVP
jgi:hypothetical protein